SSDVCSSDLFVATGVLSPNTQAQVHGPACDCAGSAGRGLALAQHHRSPAEQIRQTSSGGPGSLSAFMDDSVGSHPGTGFTRYGLVRPTGPALGGCPL